MSQVDPNTAILNSILTELRLQTISLNTLAGILTELNSQGSVAKEELHQVECIHGHIEDMTKQRRPDSINVPETPPQH